MKKIEKKSTRKSPRKAKGSGAKSPPKRVYIFSPKTRARMRKAHLGHKLSEETKQKIRNARLNIEDEIRLGVRKPFRHSEATKAHLRRVMRRKRISPTKSARILGAQERRNKALDAKLKKRADKGVFET